MPVAFASHRRVRGVRAAQVRADAERVLRALGVEGELSVVLVGDTEIRRLNCQYRGGDKPTDVLAFPMEMKARAPGAPRLLGDVVISLDTAARHAAERGVPIAEEVRTLLVHGVLHLLGYDHERAPSEARRMFRKQRDLVALLGRAPHPRIPASPRR